MLRTATAILLTQAPCYLASCWPHLRTPSSIHRVDRNILQTAQTDRLLNATLGFMKEQIAPLPLALASLPRTIDIITKRSKHPTPLLRRLAATPSGVQTTSPSLQFGLARLLGTHNAPVSIAALPPACRTPPGPLVPGARSQPARISACAQNFCLSSAPFL